VARAEYQSNLRKGSPESQKALARTYIDVGRQDMARQVLERLLRRQPKDADAAALLRRAQGPPTLKIAPLPPDPEGDAG
jgi:predicted Zn-dependent protease